MSHFMSAQVSFELVSAYPEASFCSGRHVPWWPTPIEHHELKMNEHSFGFSNVSRAIHFARGNVELLCLTTIGLFADTVYDGKPYTTPICARFYGFVNSN